MWINTMKGHKISYVFPEKNVYDIDDIAHALSQQCRFNGHTTWHYSVAEHCINLVKYVESLNNTAISRVDMLGLLMHDAQEAYIGDMASLMKQMMSEFKRLEDQFEAAMGKHFGYENANKAWIKELDKRIFSNEAEELFTYDRLGASWGDHKKGPLDWKMDFMEPETAHTEFLNLFATYHA